MMKNYFLFNNYLIIFFLITGCGFKVVNQSELINFNIENISTSGDKRINYKLKINFTIF